MLHIRRWPIIVVLALALPASAQAQQGITIIGQVTSEEGTPIPSATVQITTLGLGSVTRADGRYTLVVPANRVQPGESVTLTARAINYKPKTATVALTGAEVTQDFSLAVNPLQLGELVVTGQGTAQEVEKLGNVRNNVDSTLIQKSNEQNIVTALAAKAPNVEVTSTAGDPGASSSIRIRGANTLNTASEPLFIVDGMPIDNSTVTTSTYDGTGFGNQQGTFPPNRAIDLNSDDIESIEILKGAAAGSIYGARAGQGVILVTTKKGHSGPTSFSFRTTVSANDVTRFPELQRTYGQGELGVAESCVPITDPATQSNLVDCLGTTRSWGPAIPAGIPTYDHSREMFRTGFTTDNTLTASGGNDRTTFYISGSAFYQDGTFVGPHNNFTRYAFRLKGDHRVTNWLKVGGNVAYSAANGDGVQKTSNFSGIPAGSR